MTGFDLEVLIRNRAISQGWTHINICKLNTQLYTVQLLSFDVEKIDPILQPRVIGSATYSNGTDLAGSQTFADSKVETHTHTVTNTRTFTFSLTQSFQASAKIYFVNFGATTTFQFTWTTTHTDTQSRAVQQTWSWNALVNVPPKKRVVADVVVQEATYNPHFRARLRVRGKASLEFHEKNTHYVWSWDMGRLFQAYPERGVTVIDENTIEIEVDGIYSGVQGINYTIVTKQYDLNDGRLEAVIQGNVDSSEGLFGLHASSGASTEE